MLIAKCLVLITRGTVGVTHIVSEGLQLNIYIYIDYSIRLQPYTLRSQQLTFENIGKLSPSCNPVGSVSFGIKRKTS